jgi:radical SAM superfamily enzyme YgiQ (UPF0313 family)
LKEGQTHNIFPPIFDAYAAAVLEKEGYNVSIIDAQLETTTPTQLIERVKRANPEMIFSRISLPSCENDLKTVDMIKNSLPDVFYAGWGSICKVEPETLFSRSKLDAVIRDELEFIISTFVKAARDKGDLNEVKGISFRTSAKIVHNPSSPFKKNLDLLPLPAYPLLDMEKYRAMASYFFSEGSKNKMVKFFTILSSRGCNFNCVYCPYPTSFGPWRAMSPQRVVDEIEVLVKNYRVKVFWFHDQVFTMNTRRAEEICDEIISRGLDVSWACETHIDKLPSELMAKMRKAGCTRIQVGIETGDDQLLANIGKKGCSVDKVESVMKQLHDQGFLIEANFIVGLPGETWDTVRNTAKLIKRTKPDNVAVSMITPYPGTPLFALAKEKGWLATEDWNKFSTSQPVMALPNFSEDDMEEAQLYLRGVFLYYSRLNEIKLAAKERMFRKFLKKLGKNLPEIGIGAYLITKHAIKSRLQT